MPAERVKHPVRSRTRWATTISGSFTTNNTSSPTVTSGEGFSVARTAAGVHRITFDQNYVRGVLVPVLEKTADVAAGQLRVKSKSFTTSGCYVDVAWAESGTDTDTTGYVISFFASLTERSSQ